MALSSFAMLKHSRVFALSAEETMADLLSILFNGLPLQDPWATLQIQHTHTHIQWLMENHIQFEYTDSLTHNLLIFSCILTAQVYFTKQKHTRTYSTRLLFNILTTYSCVCVFQCSNHISTLFQPFYIQQSCHANHFRITNGLTVKICMQIPFQAKWQMAFHAMSAE